MSHRDNWLVEMCKTKNEAFLWERLVDCRIDILPTKCADWHIEKLNLFREILKAISLKHLLFNNSIFKNIAIFSTKYPLNIYTI